ncbi:MAG: hypothetical protein ABI664_02530 [bacterium]
MNVLLPSRFVETFSRLVLGVQPMDATRMQRIAHALEMRIEPKAWIDPLTDEQQRHLRVYIDLRRPLSDGWKSVTRHTSGRYALSYAKGPGNAIEVRVLDRTERSVPRRLQIPLMSLAAPEEASLDVLPVGQRSRSPFFYPGAAYDVSERVTGLRGRVVVSDGGLPPTLVPVRWPRIEARLTGGATPFAWAHGDQHGEFLLVLPPESIASPAVQMPRTLSLDITAHGRIAPPPVVPPVLVQRADPFWDLPLERLDIPGTPATSDPVALGRLIPADYTGSVMQPVTFTYSQIIGSGVPPFDIT